jgi:hypothetical protein
MLTQERLKKLLHYDPLIGIFVWKVSKRGVSAGRIAGCEISKNSYIRIMVEGESYVAHRLAWFYVYGSWPVYHIDHIDGIRWNNRINNLRDVTQSYNVQNENKPRTTNTTGVMGVHIHKQTGKYRVRIQVLGKHIHIGLFKSIEEASLAYQAAKRKLHPGFIGAVL